VSSRNASALLALAESIADGAPVDWDAAEAGASRDDQAVVRQLRVLSSLDGPASQHRGGSQCGGAATAAGRIPRHRQLGAPQADRAARWRRVRRRLPARGTRISSATSR